MKIISNFKDCYDTVQKLGTDDRVIYNRRTIRGIETSFYKIDDYFNKIPYNHKELTIQEVIRDIPSINLLANICKEHLNKLLNVSKHDHPSMLRCIGLSSDDKKKSSYFFYKSVLFFCGKLIPLLTAFKVKEEYDNKLNLIHKIEYIYDIDGFDKFVKNNDLRQLSPIKHKLKIEDWFNMKIDVNDILISNKVINVFMVFEAGYRRVNEDEFIIRDIIINPSLDQLMFQKVMDVTRMYQELDMYISGTLSYPQNAMIEVSNEEKITKHGFDKKLSFRKRKEKIV